MYNPAEKDLPAHLRLHCVQTLSWVFLPSSTHLAVDQELGMLIRKGYVGRNPLSAEFRQMVKDDRTYLKKGLLPPARFSHRPTLGGSGIGPPGTGKTMSFRLVCASYPRAIEHVYDIEGARYAFTQVPVLMLEVQPDCSIKDLAQEFFRKLGEAVGRDLVHEWDVENGSGNSLQPAIYAACREYHVGLIVLDEAQNVTAKGHKKGHAVEYLSRLMNCIGVPIVLIGTEGMGTLIQAWLALGRRFTGGIPRFEPLKKGPFWNEFLRQLWKYYYLREASNHEEFRDVILDLTAGIPDLVIKLFTLTQTRLFGRERECITVDALNETADCLFYLVKDRLVDFKHQQGEKDYSVLASVLRAAQANAAKMLEDEKQRIESADKPIEIMMPEESGKPGSVKESVDGKRKNRTRPRNAKPRNMPATTPPVDESPQTRLSDLVGSTAIVAELAKLGVLEPQM